VKFHVLVLAQTDLGSFLELCNCYFATSDSKYSTEIPKLYEQRVSS